MAGLNGMGPEGKGPLTGRRAGRCVGAVPAAGLGRGPCGGGLGRGAGRRGGGAGMGRGFGMQARVPASRDEEAERLTLQEQQLESTLDLIRRRKDELKG